MLVSGLSEQMIPSHLPATSAWIMWCNFSPSCSLHRPGHKDVEPQICHIILNMEVPVRKSWLCIYQTKGSPKLNLCCTVPVHQYCIYLRCIMVNSEVRLCLVNPCVERQIEGQIDVAGKVNVGRQHFSSSSVKVTLFWYWHSSLKQIYVHQWIIQGVSVRFGYVYSIVAYTVSCLVTMQP